MGNYEGFSQVPEAFVVTLEKGIYRQTELYEKEGKLFAKQKGGYIVLFNDGKTSVPSVKWEGINGAGYKKKSTYGRLEIDHEA